MKKIKDICEVVISGQIMSRVALDEEKNSKKGSNVEILEEAKAIIPKAIANGVVDNDELVDVKLIKHVDSKKRTQAGDVVVKLSTPYDSAVINDAQSNLVATSFCAIIKGISDDYLPEFICAYLNTPISKERLRASTAGAVIPLLRVNDLKELEIPDVSIEAQKKAVDALHLNAKRRSLLEEMLHQCDTLDESIVMSVMKKEA